MLPPTGSDVFSAHPVLITGGSGYIGAHLARRLLQIGAQVHLLLRPGSQLTLLEDLQGQFRLHRCQADTQQLIHILQTVQPQLVFHLASRFIARHATPDIEDLVQSNIAFPTQLLEAMQVAGVRRLVNTGTAWQHYSEPGYDPVCLYAATKQAFEDILEYYTRAGGLQAITLKLFDTYGPGDPRPKLMRILIEAARRGAPLAMSPGEQQLDLVYIDDVTEAFLSAARLLLKDLSPGHTIYTVSSGAPIRLRDLVELFSSISGRNLAIEWGGRPYREREVMLPWRQGQTLPGWQPQVTLEEGLRRVAHQAFPAE